MFKFRKPSICSSVSPELDVLSGTTDPAAGGGSSDRQIGRSGQQGDSVTEPRFSVLPPTTKDDENFEALSAQHYQQTRGERRESASSVASNSGALSDSAGSLVGKIVLDRKRKERHESASQGQEKKVIRSVSDDESMNDCDRNGDFRRTLSHDSFNTKQKEGQFLIGMKSPIAPDMVDLAKQPGSTGIVSELTQNKAGNLLMGAEPQFDVMRKITTSENYESELQRQLERSANWGSAPPPVKKSHKRRHRSSKRHGRGDAVEKRDEEPLEVNVTESGNCADVELRSPNDESSSDSVEDEMCAEVVNVMGNIPSVEVDEVEDVTSQTSDRLMALEFTNTQQQQKSVISMLAQFGGTSADDEVMLSPRNSVLGKEGIDIPPSPPLHQAPMDPPISRQGYLDGNPVQKMNDLSRQITALKRQLKSLEVEYEQVYGYRPSHSDKLNSKEMRKCVLQLTKSKKELKQIREDPSCLHNMSSFSGGVSGNILCVNRGNSIPPAKGTPEYAKYLEATVREIEKTLSEKRRAYNRPDDLEQMDAVELQEEKCIMQRQLLVLEKRHGRPGSKQEKDIVRPLYERYRAIKRFSVKVVCVRETSIDLVPILEHETLEFCGDNPEPVNVARTNMVNEIFQSGDRRQLQVNSDDDDRDERNDYNNMTLGELEATLRQAKDEKRRMRAMIRKFETDFQNVTGRPPQKDEKYSTSEMELAYQKYKRTKATVRLLDVLLNKRRVPALITDLNKNDD